MLLFLAGVVEQLDLALEHLNKGDLHNARFGLMLTDNALELVLHQIAKDKRSDTAGWRFRATPYAHEAKAKKAFLGRFPDKIAFAKLDGGLDAETARTFDILHDYRNDVYHAGLAHEQILHALALFYFKATCDFVGRYQSHGIGWGSATKMPTRAQKYFSGSGFMPGKREDYPAACETLAAASGHDPRSLIDALADDVERIADYMDTCLQIVADGVYVGQQVSRNQAVLDTQAWDIAFEDEGKAFLRSQNFKGNMLEAIKLIAAEYPFKFRCDPVAGWQEKAKKLRRRSNPHIVLDHYQAFITQTASLRAAIEQSAGAAEAEIEAASDRMRGK